MENKVISTPLSTGKFVLLEELACKFPRKDATLSEGVSDSASLWEPARGNRQLLSSRLFIENIHFDLTYVPLKHLGYKCISVLLSDLVAMNAHAVHARVNIALSNRFSRAALNELTDGMARCCERYHVLLSGMDIQTAPAGLMIGMSVVGEGHPDSIVCRDGAKEKELICVSGDLGAAYAGLLLLEREKKVFEANPDMQPDLAGYDYLLERQLKPEPRVDIVEALAQQHLVPTAACNVNDGLATALIHLCRASHLGCVVYENKIPIDALTFNTLKTLKIVATTIALNGGEDYEWLFTVKQEDYEKVKDIANVSVIGYMQEESAGKILITNDDKVIDLKAQGF